MGLCWEFHCPIEEPTKISCLIYIFLFVFHPCGKGSQWSVGNMRALVRQTLGHAGEKNSCVCTCSVWVGANTWEMMMMKITTNTSAMGPGCHHFHDCNVEEENIIQKVSLVTIWLIGANSKSNVNHGKGWNKRLRSSFSKHNLMLSRFINEL